MNQTPYTLHLGDCIDVMRSLPSNSVDAIVTDPPYELGFMGKAWDASGIANNVEMWREALRVLKPGGHLLAFSGSRTYHRMTCAIEDAGFEVRDQIMWLYGSGFPKSLDVSKAIDKVNGEVGRLHKFTAYMRTTGLTAKQINLATETCMGSHYITDKTQPAIPTPALWAKLRPLCGDVPDWVDALVDRIAAEREVVGQKKSGIANKDEIGRHTIGASSSVVVDVTAPATDAARRWSGWGTALKPAHEPICVARKPLIGTVAQNVLEHGTGAINVDGCRVTSEGEAEGRWPANVMHDGDAFSGAEFAKFFYCAKASKKDRDEGLEHMPEAPCGLMEDDNYAIKTGSGNLRDTRRRNTHPTVKPTELMRHLVRMVTPKGGTVLDPFTGSGSTGKACMLEGAQFIGIDMTPEYVEIARARIEAARVEKEKPQGPSNRDLFDEAA